MFSIDDTTSVTGSIGGKVAALTNEPNLTYFWSLGLNHTGANSITDGFANTRALATPQGEYPAAQACINKSDEGFNDWYLPAICELGRYVGVGDNAGCGNNNANLYSTLYLNNLSGVNGAYYSSTELPSDPTIAWYEYLNNGGQYAAAIKNFYDFPVRCIRAFLP